MNRLEVFFLPSSHVVLYLANVASAMLLKCVPAGRADAAHGGAAVVLWSAVTCHRFPFHSWKSYMKAGRGSRAATEGESGDKSPHSKRAGRDSVPTYLACGRLRPWPLPRRDWPVLRGWPGRRGRVQFCSARDLRTRFRFSLARG